MALSPGPPPSQRDGVLYKEGTAHRQRITSTTSIPHTTPAIDMNGATLDWDHKTVIGKKSTTPKLTRSESDVNGMSLPPESFSPLLTHPQLSVHLLSDIRRFLSYLYSIKARRVGAVVGTDRKTTGGTNKGHQGTRPIIFTPCKQLTYHRIGTDHQKIAKVDRENEVAPPPKISASVGKVRAFHVCSWPSVQLYIRRYNRPAWIRVFPRRIVPRRSTRSLPCYKTMNPARPYPTPKSWPNWSAR